MFPKSVKFDDYVAALKPLLDLLGTSPEATFFPLSIRAENDFPVIEFLSVVDPEDGTEPVVLGEGEWAEHAWPVAVAVI